MDRASAFVGGQHIEPSGTGTVRNDCRPGINRPSDLRNDIVRRADHDEIDVARSAREIVAISEIDVDADRYQRTCERSACSSGPDDSDPGQKQ